MKLNVIVLATANKAATAVSAYAAQNNARIIRVVVTILELRLATFPALKAE